MTNVRLAQLKSIKKLFVLFKLETLLWHATPTIFKKTAFFERLVATTGLHIRSPHYSEFCLLYFTDEKDECGNSFKVDFAIFPENPDLAIL